ncbi:hypothetical protein NL676_034976, partial [Syzygium grande]
QGEFATMMVSKVMKKLRKAKLNLSDKLVGIEDHLTKLRRMLDTDSSDVRMIVISGIPGIGKTTLAKSLYNDICHLFDRCSFLGDIQETSAKKGLVALQNQLVSDIIRRDLANFYSVEEGVSFLKDRFSTLKILILLDDLHEKTQLEALVGSLNWFGSGSRIIITTKYKLVLSGREVTETYDVTEMNHGDALKLFCRHTFAKDCPEHDYVDLSERIVSATGRLPLALELAGSHLSLFRDKKEVWEALLEKLEKLPDDDVQKKLKIHYELLSSSQRHILLDIACFLVGEDKRIASYMWKELDLFPSLELEKLCLMSMVKIGDDNRMWMHDQLRKLGRQIVQDNRMKHGNNSRLWATEARKIFKQDEVPLLPSSLAALRLTYDSSKLKSLDISNLTNLKELHLANYLEEASPGTDRNLMEEPLSLSGIGEVTKVETLKLCLSGFTTLPEMGALSQLRKLDLQCPDLQHLPQLPKSLKKLTLHDCKSLKTLPELMYLKSLSGLELLSCSVMEIQGLGNLSSLVALLISHCELVKLDGLECLTSLRTLTASYCDSLRGLPDLSNLKQLRTCNIQHCKNIPQKDSL